MRSKKNEWLTLSLALSPLPPSQQTSHKRVRQTKKQTTQYSKNTTGNDTVSNTNNKNTQCSKNDAHHEQKTQKHSHLNEDPNVFVLGENGVNLSKNVQMCGFVVCSVENRDDGG